MIANHNRAALFDTTQTDETVKIPQGLYGKQILVLILFYD